MQEIYPEDKTWIIIQDGKSVKDHGINVITLSKILQDVQKAYDNIGHSRYGEDYNKEDLQLYVDKIVPGSVAIPVYPQTFGPRLIDAPAPFYDVSTCFEKLIETLDTKPEDFTELLEKEITDPSNRLGLLKSMESLTKNDSRITLKISADKPLNGPTFDKKNTNTLKTIISTYTKPAEMTVRGIMLGFHAEKDYYFTLKTENGRTVRCYFNPESTDAYQNYFWKWVTVKGDGITTQKSYTLKTVTGITEEKTIILDKIGEYQLKKPLTLKTSYEKEDKLCGLVCEELAIYGYGENYRKTITSLEEEIESLAICFTKYSDEELTKESPEIKKKLQEYIDIKAVYDNTCAKIGEAE